MRRHCASSSSWQSVKRIRSAVDNLLKKFWGKFGYTIFGEKDRLERESGFVIKPVGLKLTSRVQLLSLRVWTEGEEKCRHVYHKVRPMNSHKNAIARSGKTEHDDYVCSECTHKLCVSKWGNADG